MKGAAIALLIVLFEPAYMAVFLACFLLAWSCTVIALAVTLVTCGTWCPPKIGEHLISALQVPRRWALGDLS